MPAHENDALAAVHVREGPLERRARKRPRNSPRNSARNRPLNCPRKRRAGASLASILVLLFPNCGATQGGEMQLEVTATAYNSVASQTGAGPRVAAWGDRLEPGMKAIAVSRDLIRLGLHHGVAVEIEGFTGLYIVRDKMASRWRKRIDIYMGKDVEAAESFGKRRLTIRWQAPRSHRNP